MSKTFYNAVIGFLILVGAAGSLTASVPIEKTLPGHVPSVVSRLARTGSVPATNDLHLAIGLQLRNQSDLDSLVSQVIDPASPNYHHYLTPDEFVQRFAPTPEDYQAVADFAQAKGLKISATSSNRMILEVTGKAADVQNAFKVSFHTYNHPTENRTFFAPDQEPTVPVNLAILDVSGLNNYARPHNHVHVRSEATNAAAATAPHFGSGPFGTYMGNDFRAAYMPGTSLTGSGQKIALVQFDGYFGSDIAQYESMNGLPNVSLTNILLNGFSGFPVTFNGNLEVSLDIEMSVAMAPGINQVMVYEGDPFNFFPNVVLNQIAQDNAAHQVSCSWGWIGGPNATTDQIFKEMILQGQTFYHATGDNDALTVGEADDPGLFFYPSSDPYIVQVGATTLTTTGPGGSYVSETVWNWGTEFGTNYDGIGSSGGYSSHYLLPSWQTNLATVANGGSSIFRNFPDVALVGDNILVVASGGVQIIGVGGTSCAAPLWAAVTAMINQQSSNLGRAPIGFINPTIYALSKGLYYGSVFNDITAGSSIWSGSPTQFIAVTNYDLCTGLGTPRPALINALTSITNVTTLSALIPAPLPPWGNTLSVMNGSNPNGFWLFYMRDETANSHGGTNYNGWSINLTTANPVGPFSDNQLTVNTTVNSTPYGNFTNVIAGPGSTWQTTLAVTNWGPSLSSNVFVADTLPVTPGVSLQSSTMTLGVITNFGGNLVWSLGNLATNVGGTLTLNFHVNSSGTYTNAASVTSATTDPNPDDDSIGVIANVAAITPPVVVPAFKLGSGGMFKLSITNDAGATIIVQGSTNLLAWVPLWTNVAPCIFTNFDSTNMSKRFYRAIVSQ